MKRQIRKSYTEYVIDITMCEEYIHQKIVAENLLEVNSEDLIEGIYIQLKEKAESLGLQVLGDQQSKSNKSEAKYLRLRIPDVDDTIITIIFRIAEHKPNSGFRNSTDKAVQKQSGMYVTVLRWFDVSGITKESSLRLLAYMNKILNSLARKDISPVLALPKVVKRHVYDINSIK